MTKSRKSEPPILQALEDLYTLYRPKVKPIYPYDPKTDTIYLPHEVDEELKQLVLAGEKVEAVKRVSRLTGAGLRVSKDYLDALLVE